MMTLRRRSHAVLAALGGLALLPVAARAQAPSTKGEIHFGARQLFGDRASSKFLEYRSLPEGLYLQSLSLGLDWDESNHYVAVRAENALQGDQYVKLRGGRRGAYEFAVEFDKTPHLFSNSGRTLYSETAPGVFRMPDDIQQQLRVISTTDIDPKTAGRQVDLARLQALVNGLARPVDLSLTRERSKASFRYAPSPGWDLQIQYTLENERGARPFGATFTFNPTEQAEPIDYRSQEFRANVERSGEDWVIQLGFARMMFRNFVNVLEWDNAWEEVNAAGRASAGRIDLYPDNRVNQATASAAWSLSPSTLWTVSGAYGVMSQDDPFIPFTVNPAVANVPALPATSANGKVKTSLLNSTLTSRPVPELAITARYRYYDKDNQTPSLIFQNYVRTDQQLGGVARRSLPYGYTRQNAGLDLSWRMVPAVTLKGGYEWEGWDRDYRETLSTAENTLGGAVDVTHEGWLFVRAAYRRSNRSEHDYEAHRVAEEAFPNGEPGLGQLEELRKLDQASRKRDRAEIIARLSPGESFSLSAAYSLTTDDFHETEYGLEKAESRSPSVEITYSPSSRFTLFGELTRENNDWDMRSRQRNPAAGATPANDKAANDWVSEIRDHANTYGVGLTGELIPDKMEIDLSYDISDGNGLTSTHTPGTPDLVTTAADYPAIVSDSRVLAATLQYKLSERVSVRLDHRYEKYESIDFALDRMAPFMGFVEAASAATTWLGVTRPGFSAHVSSLGFVYRF